MRTAQHNNRIERVNKSKQTKLLRYGDGNYNNYDKAKITKKELYGNENYHNIEQMKETNKLKYGKEYYSQTDEWVDKVKRTTNLHYNTDFYFQSEDCRNKTKLTCLEKYNAEFYTKSDDYKAKTEQTCLERYGTTYPLSHYSKCRSNFEDKITDYIKELKINYIQNNRTLLNGKEIDILFPNINKCIEVQGTYWHCDPRFYDGDYFHKVKNKTASEIWEYDLSKKLLIESKNLQVLYIWEYDWDNNTDAIKLQIKEFLK